jgi:hypothetical protein
MDFILQIFWINFILFLWFETDGFIEYAKLFRLSKIFKIDKFKEYKEESNPRISYLDYIRQKHNCFLSRLFTCTPCLNFWIVLLITFIFNSLFIYPVVYILSYVIYKLLKKYIYGEHK